LSVTLEDHGGLPCLQLRRSVGQPTSKLNLDLDEACDGRPCGTALIREHLRGASRPVQSAIEITAEESSLSADQPSLGLILSESRTMQIGGDRLGKRRRLAKQPGREQHLASAHLDFGRGSDEPLEHFSALVETNES
jgi:hypothetical protein